MIECSINEIFFGTPKLDHLAKKSTSPINKNNTLTYLNLTLPWSEWISKRVERPYKALTYQNLYLPRTYLNIGNFYIFRSKWEAKEM